MAPPESQLQSREAELRRRPRHQLRHARLLPSQNLSHEVLEGLKVQSLATFSKTGPPPASAPAASRCVRREPAKCQLARPSSSASCLQRISSADRALCWADSDAALRSAWKHPGASETKLDWSSWGNTKTCQNAS